MATYDPIWTHLEERMEMARRFQMQLETEPKLKATLPPGFVYHLWLLTDLDANDAALMEGGAIPVIEMPDGSQESIPYRFEGMRLETGWAPGTAERRLQALKQGARFLLRRPDGSLVEPNIEMSLVD